MASKRTLTWVCNFLLISMGFLALFIEAYRPSFEGKRRLTGNKSSQNKEEAGGETTLFRRFVGGTAALFFDSARQVPTGPDPLHHNSHPSLGP